MSTARDHAADRAHALTPLASTRLTRRSGGRSSRSRERLRSDASQALWSTAQAGAHRTLGAPLPQVVAEPRRAIGASAAPRGASCRTYALLKQSVPARAASI